MTHLDLKAGLAIHDNIGIRVGTGITYYKIRNRDVIELLDSDFSSLGSGSTLSFTEITELNPPNEQIYQIFNIEIARGNVKLQVKQPSSTNRFGVEREPSGGFITDKNDDRNLNIWITQDYPPSIQIVNDTNVSVTPVLRYRGWRYHINPLKTEPKRYTLVNIGGIAR